jgi:3D (Asp-Asp-Asp) domain-containing protein
VDGGLDALVPRGAKISSSNPGRSMAAKYASGSIPGPPAAGAGASGSPGNGGASIVSGGWFSGTGRRYVPLPGVTFAPGPAQPLRYYQSLAVDPTVIPLGSRVYVPAYRQDGHGGWFIAQDTGGAITGRHVDVYRKPAGLSHQRKPPSHWAACLCHPSALVSGSAPAIRSDGAH